MYNKSLLSWNGQAGNISFKETLDYIYKSYVDGIFYTMLPAGNVTQSYKIPYGFCQIYVGQISSVFRIEINATGEDMEHFVFLSDPDIANPFQANDGITGDKIKSLTPVNGGRYTIYRLALRETRKLASDGTCAHYPFKGYAKYRYCVEAEIRAKMMPVRGCMVPWTSTTNQCLTPIPRRPEDEELLTWHYDFSYKSWGGIQYRSDRCPLPCNTISVKSTYQVGGSHRWPKSQLIIYVEDRVKIEKVQEFITFECN